jgi:Flp pilus assembly protein TadB
MSNNQFLKDYGQRVEDMNYTLQECIMSGFTDGKLNLEEVMELFRGTIAEIKQLQEKVNALSEALRNNNEK